MKVVVSGTHASGKSTLVGRLADALDGAAVLPDPFELVDHALDEPDVTTFLEQLHVAADRLREPHHHGVLVAERGPLDLLAYLEALVDLGRPGADAQSARDAREVVAAAMGDVDLVLLLDPDDVPAPDDEDPELRSAMHATLLDLLDDPDLLGGAAVVDVAGDPDGRVDQALRAIAAHEGRA